MGRCFIGTSGYVYKHWRGLFYPQALPVRDWLPFYAQHFDTVELNNPFYRLPAEQSRRLRLASDGAAGLRVCREGQPLPHASQASEATVGASAALPHARRCIAGNAGPRSFPAPRAVPLDVDRLRRFLRVLDRQRYVPGLRAVLEVRHESWLVPEVFDLLTRANVALCLQDWREAPVRAPVTADFVYIRRHGTTHRYGGSYSDTMLRADARAIRAWLREGRDVYVYFNNDGHAYAVRNAQRLACFYAVRTPKPHRHHSLPGGRYSLVGY